MEMIATCTCPMKRIQRKQRSFMLLLAHQHLISKPGESTAKDIACTHFSLCRTPQCSSFIPLWLSLNGALYVSMSKTACYLQCKSIWRHISFHVHTQHSWRKFHQKVLQENSMDFPSTFAHNSVGDWSYQILPVAIRTGLSTINFTPWE